MWKYILIALFVLLAIREINLMNQSLYIAPDNKIVAEDRTTATELKKLINKIEHNEFLLNEPETIEEANISSHTEEKTQTPEPTPSDKEINLTQPQESVQNQPQSYSVPQTIPETVPEQNSTETPPSDTTVPEQNITAVTETPALHEDEEQSTASRPVPDTTHITKQATQPEIKKKPAVYPENFESAEEKVRRILAEMKAAQ